MGERAGYRIYQPQGYCTSAFGPELDVEHPEMVSPIVRKQWYLGGEPADIQSMIMAMADHLACAQPVDSGMGALRHDLDITRAFPALIKACRLDGFGEIEYTPNCDICDHGLYEIELVTPFHWKVNHYNIDFIGYVGDHKNPADWLPDQIGPKQLIAEVTFDKGKPLPQAAHFVFYFEHEGTYDHSEFSALKYSENNPGNPFLKARGKK